MPDLKQITHWSPDFNIYWIFFISFVSFLALNAPAGQSGALPPALLINSQTQSKAHVKTAHCYSLCCALWTVASPCVEILRQAPGPSSSARTVLGIFTVHCWHKAGLWLKCSSLFTVGSYLWGFEVCAYVSVFVVVIYFKATLTRTHTLKDLEAAVIDVWENSCEI